MKHVGLAVAAALVLTGCSTISYYAPEAGPQWRSLAVKVVAGQGNAVSASVDGVTVTRVSTEYSPVVSSGDLLEPTFQGSAQERWSVQGPDGLTATVEVVVFDVLYVGVPQGKTLTPTAAVPKKARRIVRLITPGGRWESAPVSDAKPSKVTIDRWSIEPSQQYKAGSKVYEKDFLGTIMGYHLAEDGQPQGYLWVFGDPSLKRAPTGGDPLLTALGLVLAQPHFEASLTVPRAVASQATEFIGVPFSRVTLD